ncbi:MAG: hypothetical protein QM756_01985 [Polyangiaceae bacterium]
MLFVPQACGGGDDDDKSSGGSTSSGGSSTSSGGSSKGGGAATGGAKASGGTGTSSGGSAQGGAAPEGGAVSEGGANPTSGGSVGATGGAGGAENGGETGTGGSATGGSGGQTASYKASAIAVGRLHSCAVTTTGAVLCWGSHDHGQVGNNVIHPTSASLAPVQVQGLTAGATAISSFGDHTCAVVSGGVKCWGLNDQGQLGNGTQTESAVPVTVAGLTGVTAVAVGDQHSCALTSAGAVKCWGKNDYGQLGNDSTVEFSTAAVDVTGLSSGVAAISAGFGHVCAVTTAGGMKCWGSNLYGEQGLGVAGNGAHKPGDVSGLTSGVAAIGLGEYVSCAGTTAGALKCWGRNDSGQLGNGASGTQVQEPAPVAVSGVTAGATAVSSGYGFTCGVISGAAKCWGSNFYLVIGNGGSPSLVAETPVAVTGLGSGVVAIAATSSDHACALTTAGAIKCWGSSGSLGHGTADDSATPVAVVGFP